MITALIPPYSGLGNLLFQYAYARHLAIRNQTEVLMDFSLCFSSREIFEPKASRYLGCFNLKCDQKIPGVLCRSYGALFNKINSYPDYPDLLVEGLANFSPQMLDQPDNTTLFGYFQSHKYFQDVAALLKPELQITLSSFSSIFLDIQTRIRDGNSVAMHIRRKDYLQYDDFNICGLEYYMHADAEMSEKIDRPIFFIFSDDMVWARENIKIRNSVFVNLPDSQKNPVYDLLLISLCKHQIIANSTFSWWGAWLNENPEKIVVAPAVWHKDPVKNARAMQQTLPEEWIKISV